LQKSSDAEGWLSPSVEHSVMESQKFKLSLWDHLENSSRPFSRHLHDFHARVLRGPPNVIAATPQLFKKITA
jgi:hypothetical protein